MKKITTIILAAISTFSLSAQSIDLNSLGTLVTNDRGLGSGRFEAMSGAFGALGAIPSSLTINPAGISVANSSALEISIGVKSTDTKTLYYGNTEKSTNESFNLNQAGGVFVLEDDKTKDWNKIALGFNYQLKNDFENQYFASGNSGVAYFNEDPDNTSTIYNNGESQKFDNITKGKSSQFNIGISGVYQNQMHIGASINIHSLDYRQTTILKEVNSDGNGNKINVYNEQINNYFDGDSNGLSLGLGLIYKPIESLRLGVAYESPTWYPDILEDTNVSEDNLGYTEITSSNIDGAFKTDDDLEGYAFRLRTPSKLTASAAYVFEKMGLISIDYAYKNYAGIKFSDGDFSNVNKSFSNNFRAVSILNVGTEWRFDNLSVRGGYHYEQNPEKTAKKSDNLKGFSAGLGYDFGSFNIDLSYRRDNNTGYYNIYPQDLNVSSVELDNTISRFNASIGFKF